MCLVVRVRPARKQKEKEREQPSPAANVRGCPDERSTGTACVLIVLLSKAQQKQLSDLLVHASTWVASFAGIPQPRVQLFRCNFSMCYGVKLSSPGESHRSEQLW